jgi:hypothetical protein
MWHALYSMHPLLDGQIPSFCHASVFLIGANTNSRSAFWRSSIHGSDSIWLWFPVVGVAQSYPNASVMPDWQKNKKTDQWLCYVAPEVLSTYLMTETKTSRAVIGTNSTLPSISNNSHHRRL